LFPASWISVVVFNHSPICSRQVAEQFINQHIDAGCRDAIPGPSTPKMIRVSSASAHPVAPIFKAKAGGPTRHDHDLSTSQQQPLASQRAATSRPSQKRKLMGDASPLAFAAPTISRPSQVRQNKSTFGSRLQAVSPLAERLRPNTLDEFVGQSHLTGPGSFLSALTEKGVVGSIILWGPPG
jgi:putative ATPase